MSTRLDELKGQLKKGVGSLTGNDEMRREGEAEATVARTQREVEGAVDEAVGTAQQKIGEVSGDRETELKGRARQAEGEAKRS